MFNLKFNKFNTKKLLKPKKIKRYEFQGVLAVLLFALLLTGVQSFQLYSIKSSLVKEGLGAFSQGAGNAGSSQSSAIPDQVGGCFRG